MTCSNDDEMRCERAAASDKKQVEHSPPEDSRLKLRPWHPAMHPFPPRAIYSSTSTAGTSFAFEGGKPWQHHGNGRPVITSRSWKSKSKMGSGSSVSKPPSTQS